MRLNDEDMEVLASMLAAEVEPEPFDPGKKGREKKIAWEPLHGPTQRKIFRDRADIVGGCGEKYTGKSIVMADKVIAHCYSEWDALAVIIGNSHRALAEGICHDLTTFSLPRWRDGNQQPLYIMDGQNLVENPKAGEKLDAGIGLEFTAWKTDPNNKDLYLKIKNKFGGWSRIRVISIPYGNMVEDRVKNLNASLYYLEEATNCDGPEFFLFPSMQLYRRRDIVGPQQFLFSCNPEDPANWVHKWMYEDVVVGKDEPGRDYPEDPEKPGIRRDISVSFYYLHYEENKHNVSQKNREMLMKNLRANPILRARLVDSKWIAMPSGEAIFKNEFSEGRHIRGDLEKMRGITPIPGFPIVISMDWGPRSVGIVFNQIIDAKDGTLHIVFDEITYHLEMVKTRRLAVGLLEKMRFWNEWLREKKADQDRAWSWWFITGDDTTTTFNPESGSINARDLEDHMKAAISDDDSGRYRGILVPRLRGCPRPRDSVGKRVDLIAEELMEDRLIISAHCQGVRGMFFHLERDPDDPSKPKSKNRWIHIFDGLSYAVFYRRFVLVDGYYNFDARPAFSVA